MAEAPATILIADDDPYLCEMLCDAFASLSAECVSVGSAEALRREIRRRTYDVLVLDTFLPDASGLELLTRIRRESPATEVICMTGVPWRDWEARARAAGAAACFGKPFNVDQLCRAVADAARTARARLTGPVSDAAA